MTATPTTPTPLAERVRAVQAAADEIAAIRRQTKAGTFRGNAPAREAIERCHAAFGIFQGHRRTQAEREAWQRMHALIFELAERREPFVVVAGATEG